VFHIGRSTYKDIQDITRSLQIATQVFPRKWRKALHDAGDIAHKYYGRQFKSMGSEFGGKWKELAPGTQKDRKRKGYRPRRPILVRRGWLRATMISKRSANAKRVVTNRGIVMKSTLRTKSGLNMYSLHQKGGGKLPARKISREGQPPFISRAGWEEIRTRFVGMFFEIRREMERA
jgi:hypothetical protein